MRYFFRSGLIQVEITRQSVLCRFMVLSFGLILVCDVCLHNKISAEAAFVLCVSRTWKYVYNFQMCFIEYLISPNKVQNKRTGLRKRVNLSQFRLCISQRRMPNDCHVVFRGRRCGSIISTQYIF